MAKNLLHSMLNVPYNKPHDWKDEWVGMPEYNNTKPKKQEITATFKFRNKDDYNKFMEVVKSQLYDNKRVFDGNQKKNEYSAWFPLDARPSEYVYIEEEHEN